MIHDEKALKAEVLRYLGYNNQKLDWQTNALIELCLLEIEQLKRIKSIYRFFPVVKTETGLNLAGTNLNLPGINIKRLLLNSKSALLIALTLGHEIDRLIRYYQKTDLSKAVIFDACATALIEAAVEELVAELTDKLNLQDQKLTPRYSPGYGDLPLDLQKPLLNVLDANRLIGLTVSTANILLPRKSITAIAGVIPLKVDAPALNCLTCSHYESCHYSKV